ncbi:MAG: ABC-F family ATP-binding cassette domain-containing protein [Phycisphaerae bacterium]|nr:ABC-F family ATP-binding cassette domain-containing protein [Phycisphaerae bacterium]
MAVVSLQNVVKQFGTRVVLDGLSLDLHPGQIAGLIGVNGVGKTTLFRLIAGEIQPDTGEVIRSAGVDIGYLRQEPDIDPNRTLHDEVARAFDELLEIERRMHEVSAEMAACPDDKALEKLMASYDRLHERFVVEGGNAMEARLGEILGGLGFSPEDYHRPLRVMSGGQKCRAALARLLLADSTFLLLDEPTNHLDIDAVRWLERFLANHRGGAVIISHDRYLLDRTCERIIEIDRGKARSYPGNYSNYAQTRARAELTQQRQFEKDAAFIRKEKDFIARHLAGQRTKEAQGRRTRLERKLNDGDLTTESVTQRKKVRIDFASADAGQGTVVRCDDLAMSFGDRRVFEGLRLQLDAGQRMGITGPNGVGKTTLLKIVLGELDATAGEVIVDPSLRIGYYTQEHFELDHRRSVLEEIRAARPEMSEHEARSYLARFLFTGDDVFKKLGMLSGGEQSRVRLASLILQGPDLLVLDEPTNHLDIPSRECLEEALVEYAGTILTVSHDRYFLDRVVHRLLVMRPSHWAAFNGNYTFHIEELERQKAALAAAATASESADASQATKTALKKQRKAAREAQAPRKTRSPTAQYDHLTVEQIESMVVEQETRLAELHEKFGDPRIVTDPEALAELQEQMDEVSAELAVLDQAWQERVEGMK